MAAMKRAVCHYPRCPLPFPRRAIRNRESATASRLRRKEYIENLEKRMSELSSQNTLLNISVTEMQMREKDKREEEERIRSENEKLRADTEATRAENVRLREEKSYMQQVQEKLSQFKVGGAPLLFRDHDQPAHAVCRDGTAAAADVSCCTHRPPVSCAAALSTRWLPQLETQAAGGDADEIAEPPTWPPPKQKPAVVVVQKRLSQAAAK
jgi:hypothetical protein